MNVIKFIKHLLIFVKIACEIYHSVTLKNDGSIECLGNNEFNQCDQVYKSFTNIKLHQIDYILK